MIVAREPFSASYHGAPTDVVDLREGLVLPGFVDTHVHFPQVRAIGGLGMPLLDWLEKCALPEEARLADTTYAASVAADFVSGLARAGTTTALVFGSHFAGAVDALFTEAARVGLRVTSGLVLSDRILREDLFTTPDRAYDEGLELAKRWHGVGPDPLRRHAALLAVVHRRRCSSRPARCWATCRTSGSPRTSTRTSRRSRASGSCSAATTRRRTSGPGCSARAACSPTTCTRRCPSCCCSAHHGAAVAHCPTSNAALGSGLFPLGSHLAARRPGRARLRRRRRAPASRCSRRGCRPTSSSSCSAARGHRLSARHLLHLATSAGADVLGLVGRRSVTSRSARSSTRCGCGPPPGCTLDVALRHADSPDDALAKAFALAGPADVAGTWVARRPGYRSRREQRHRTTTTSTPARSCSPRSRPPAATTRAGRRSRSSSESDGAHRRPRGHPGRRSSQTPDSDA